MTTKNPPSELVPISPDAADRIRDFTIAANQIASVHGTTNAYEMRNALLEARRKARVRYQCGQTLPATAEKLRADAERKVRHSRTLARNIKNATGVAKHAEADAHHIVAQVDQRAYGSRRILFGWGIGINDADNGIYLPKKRSSRVPGLEGATAHQHIHTDEYHLAVRMRLSDAGREAERGRFALRGIKGEILGNRFTY